MKTRRNGLRREHVLVPMSRKLRVFLMGDPAKPEARELGHRLSAFLRKRATVIALDLERSRADVPGKPDLVVVLGGDGALITACGRLGRRQVPVMGVNLGMVGFLTAVAPGRAEDVLATVLEGKAPLENHAMMQTRVRRRGEVIHEAHLLNEVVVDSASSSMVDIDLRVDRRPVCTYRGDGLIVATATGSTAYSLAAGGPILSPRLDAFVVTPLAPHMLTQRPLVLPGQRIATLRVNGPARFVADGMAEHALERGDEVRIGPSTRRFQLVVDPEANFFARLRSKLHWGLSPGQG